MTQAGDHPIGLPAGRAPVGEPGPRWSGDGSLRPKLPPTRRVARSVDDRAGRTAPSGAAIASFPRRCGGFIIDFLIISMIYALVLTIVFGDAEPADIGRVDSTWLPFVLTGLIVRVAYNSYWNRLGWSPGKRMWGMRLESMDGERPALRRALGRALFAEVSLFLWIGYLWASWDRGGQTWHDRVAHTWVVRVERAPGGPDASSS